MDISSTSTSKNIEFVITQFGINYAESTVSTLGNGLINCTYLVKSPTKTFVLQKINQGVFKQAKQVISNAELIDKCLATAIEQGEYPLSSINQLSTIDDKKFIEIGDELWRTLYFIPNCFTVETIENTEQASQAATAFAQFTSALSSISAEKLAIIIPDFHNLSFRLEQLQNVIKNDPVNRLQSSQEQVTYCLEQADFICEVADMVAQLPLHVTHNDTKINNLLFCKESKQPIAVIDLDTCMPGLLMHDFGDMVRTCCSTLPEDGSNIDEMEIRLDIFDALLQAYIAGFGDNISEIEKQSLITGARLLPFMIGVRFLTDYIDGDNYFSTQYDEHNLVRAKNQFQLFSLLNQQVDRLKMAIG
jgi:thiamine kinase-like enzyme